MVVRIQMEAEDVSNEVRQYSIVVGFLLIVVFVVPCVAFALLSKYCQKQTRKRKQPTVTSLLQLQHRSSVFRNLPSSDNPTAVRDSSSESSSDVCNYGPLGLVDCSLENLEGLERITGSMGACMSCLDTWKAKVPSAVADKEVVGKLISVKKISATNAKAHIPCLKADLATLSRIPPHPLLLNLLGVCTSGGVPQALMLEYPPHGSFHSFLVLKRRAMLSDDAKPWPAWTHRASERNIAKAMRADVHSLSPQLANPDLRCHPYAQPLNSSFTDLDLLLLVLQIASAMDHLTSRNILHQGLSSENVMIGSAFFLKLTGVHTDSSSLHKEPSMRQLRRTASGRNLYKWDAPEVMEMGHHTEQSEMWRFGMTLWEVSSLGDMPFADTPNRTLSEIVKSGQRPHAPDCCSKQLYQLMMECWNLKPDLRPGFPRIVERIQDMLSFKDSSRRSSATSLQASSSIPEHPLLHWRGSRGKRPLLYSHSSPSLFTDNYAMSSATSPPAPLTPAPLTPAPLTPTPLTPASLTPPLLPHMHTSRLTTKVVLEGIPEGYIESDV